MVTAGWGSSLSVSPTTRNFYFCSRFFPRNWQKELSCELAVLQSDIPSADDLIPKIEQELGTSQLEDLLKEVKEKEAKIEEKIDPKPN